MATTKQRPRILMHFSIDKKEIGALEIEVYNDVVPTTARNFIDLCLGTHGYGYSGNKIHRIVKGFLMQGGDIVNNDGTSGKSIYGAKFKDESFKIKHSSRGILSMANAGPNTNNSQFMITFNATPFLDNRHVAFGKVVMTPESSKVLETLEEAGVPSDNYSLPSTVEIVRCELVPTDEDKN